MENRDKGDDDDVGPQWELTGLTGAFKYDLQLICEPCKWITVNKPAICFPEPCLACLSDALAEAQAGEG